MLFSIMCSCLLYCGFGVENPNFPVDRVHWVFGVFWLDQSWESFDLGNLGLVIYVFLLVPSAKADSLLTIFPASINLTKLYSKSLRRWDGLREFLDCVNSRNLSEVGWCLRFGGDCGVLDLSLFFGDLLCYALLLSWLGGGLLLLLLLFSQLSVLGDICER